MKRFQNRFLFSVVVFCALFGFAGGATWLSAPPPQTRMLCIRNAEGALLLREDLSPEQEFAVRFVHSVAKTPVEEWFRGEDDGLVLVRTVYQDFGAGLPHEVGKEQHMDFRDGKVEISGLKRRLPRLELRVGVVAEHEVVLPSRVVRLDSLAPPKSALTFSLENLPSSWPSS